MRGGLAGDIALAVGVHVAALVALGLSFSAAPPVSSEPDTRAIQAVTVDESQVKAAMERIAEQRQQAKEKRQAELERVERERKAEEKRLAEARAKRKSEAERQKKLEQQRKAEAERRRRLEQQRKAEEKRLAELKAKRKAEAQRQKKLEQQRKAEAERQRRLEQQRKAEEKRLAELKAKRQAEQAQREAALKKALAEERAARAAERAVASLSGVWNNQISGNWTRPPTVPDGLTCVIRIRVAPSGLIRSAELVESSGNGAFDQSALRAVRKTAELRMPNDEAVAKRLSPINLRFSPQG